MKKLGHTHEVSLEFGQLEVGKIVYQCFIKEEERRIKSTAQNGDF